MAIQARTFYASSNGDTWSLCRSPTGDIVVAHQPNSASGGKPSEVDLGTFLATGNRSPEHQSLRQLIGELVDPDRIPAGAYDDHD